MTMMEKLARAMWRATNPPGWEGTPDADLDWSINCDTFRKQAAAVLRALRDPDEGMVEAMAPHMTRREAWQAGIDSILSQASDPGDPPGSRHP